MGAFSDGLYFEDLYDTPRQWRKATMLRLGDPDNYLYGVRLFLSDKSKLARHWVRQLKKDWREVEAFVSKYGG